MKTTLFICLLALGGVAMADYVAHGITFDTDTTEKAAQNQSPENHNLYIVAGGKAYGNTLNFQGLYLADGAGYQSNTQSGKTINCKYLYIGNNITCSTSSGSYEAGLMNFGTKRTGNYSITGGTDAWLDVNTDIGNFVTLTNMDGGTVYLNAKGHISSALTAGCSVVVDALNEMVVSEGLPSDFYHLNSDGSVTRTLLTGDFSSWTEDDLAKVSISNMGQGYAHADAQGLYVTYTPEPATATLSLLALAGLAARRRRH